MDGGKEFYNKDVRKFCNENNMHLHFIQKGSPWLQAFIERGFRTIKKEFLNLVWIGDWNKFNDVLRDARYGYNNRPNSAPGYKNPLEVMVAKNIKFTPADRRTLTLTNILSLILI
ncbi:MAG: integrase core domain-containing protein [Methanolobus sp.]|nr:integrase core domain-containing protein [Methanolobus sp.]